MLKTKRCGGRSDEPSRVESSRVGWNDLRSKMLELFRWWVKVNRMV